MCSCGDAIPDHQSRFSVSDGLNIRLFPAYDLKIILILSERIVGRGIDVYGRSTWLMRMPAYDQADEKFVHFCCSYLEMIVGHYPLDIKRVLQSNQICKV